MARNIGKLKRLNAKGFFLKEQKASLNKRISVDMGNFTKSANKLINQLATNMGQAKRLFKVISLKLFEAIQVGDASRGLPGTPVDLGAARASWQIEVEKDTDKELRIRIFSEGVEYIIFLEFGSSDQAPRGMFRIAIRKFKREIGEKLSGGIK